MVRIARRMNGIDVVVRLYVALAIDLSCPGIDEAKAIANHLGHPRTDRGINALAVVRFQQP